ncbi:hypothetical protein L211DRAFT_199822 [Terfezia boudieri ATCC MYA-4762]|uniref:Uncharacterized protein n=1 Tax=Terfezia boudieri ATCC MYA-4762 TaxID=1051890 RepID=A0A3N4LM35_9PEZI|nr:hypothetical protein L211DRAFT_199822 [Terfezia boudieri ATCC MYA-4762]
MTHSYFHVEGPQPSIHLSAFSFTTAILGSTPERKRIFGIKWEWHAVWGNALLNLMVDFSMERLIALMEPRSRISSTSQQSTGGMFSSYTCPHNPLLLILTKLAPQSNEQRIGRVFVDAEIPRNVNIPAKLYSIYPSSWLGSIKKETLPHLWHNSLQTLNAMHSWHSESS